MDRRDTVSEADLQGQQGSEPRRPNDRTPILSSPSTPHGTNTSSSSPAADRAPLAASSASSSPTRSLRRDREEELSVEASRSEGEAGRLMKRLLNGLKSNYMIPCLGLALLLALADPSLGKKGGPLEPEMTTKGIIVFIFFASGVTLPTNELKESLLQWKLHLLTQSIIFCCVPSIIFLLVHFVLKPLLLTTTSSPSPSPSSSSSSSSWSSSSSSWPSSASSSSSSWDSTSSSGSSLDDDPHTSSSLEGLLLGLTFMSCVPSTNTTNVLMTRASGGNTAAALFNAVFSNSIGIVVTPLLLILLGAMPSTYELSFRSLSPLFLNLFLIVLLPMIIGQLFRFFFNSYIAPRTAETVFPSSWCCNWSSIGGLLPWALLNNIGIVAIVYFTFCDTFSQSFSDLSWSLLIFVCGLVIFIFVLFNFLIWFFLMRTPHDIKIPALHDHSYEGGERDRDSDEESRSRSWKGRGHYSLTLRRWFSLNRGDVIAVLFCGTQKTLGVGVTFLTLIYGKAQGEEGRLAGLVIIPLLVYHPIQLSLGTLLIPFLKAWVERQAEEEGEDLFDRHPSDSQRETSEYKEEEMIEIKVPREG